MGDVDIPHPPTNALWNPYGGLPRTDYVFARKLINIFSAWHNMQMMIQVSPLRTPLAQR